MGYGSGVPDTVMKKQLWAYTGGTGRVSALALRSPDRSLSSRSSQRNMRGGERLSRP